MTERIVVIGADAAGMSAASQAKRIAGYFPSTRQMTVKMIAERCTGRLLGVQIVGSEGSAERIDTAATALWNRG